MLHKVTMFTRILIFCSILSLTISEEISPSLNPAHGRNISVSDNQTLPINSTKRIEPLAINISDLLRKYARELSNSSVSSSSFTGKKAYIQEESQSQTQAPPTYQNGLNGINGINGLFDSGPNGNIFGQVTVTDLVPYIVENVLSPLVQRVIVEGNLVNNIYSLWRGVSEGGAAQAPAPAPAPDTAQAATDPPKQYVVDIAVEEEMASTPKSAPPKKRRTRGSTTTEKSSTSSSSGGKEEVTEKNRQGEAESSTTSKSKYKVITRTRVRTSTSTSSPNQKSTSTPNQNPTTSTQKSINYEENQDDEDETQIFNKLSHL